MSVIVMGMKRPEGCDTGKGRCIFTDYNGIGRCQLMKRIWDPDPGQPLRPDWCPLRPLPEKHGRLIDAKVLDAAFTDLRFNDDGTLRHWGDRKNWCLHGGEVESLIADAPTIVESEGE